MYSEEKARKIIEEIRLGFGLCADGSQQASFEKISRNLRNAIEQLAEGIYQEDIHFILELIQNAEDNSYEGVKPDLKFILSDTDPTNTKGSDGCLCIINNEVGFDESNVNSICQIGESTKTKQAGFVGEKGIGFKSVFIVSTTPHIYSNGFRFKFKEKDPDIPLSYIVPFWLESEPDMDELYKRNTVILLPLKKEKRHDIQLKLSQVKPETILFLSKLEGLYINLESMGQNIDLQKDATNFPVVNLVNHHKDSGSSDVIYWLHKENVQIPADMNEEKRKGLKEREITIAFPLGESGQEGTVYAYLPTEAKSGLPFLINSDFILTANRESIQTDKPWNIWLRNKLPSVITKAIVDISKSKLHRKTLYKFIPCDSNSGSLKDYFSPVFLEVQSNLRNLPIVLADTGIMVVPDKVRSAPNKIRELFPVCNRPGFFGKASFVDPEIEKFREQLKIVGVSAFLVSELVECLSDRDWMASQNMSWFNLLYNYLGAQDKLTKEKLSNLFIVPTNNSGLSSPRKSIYIPEVDGQWDKLVEQINKNKLPDINFLNPELYVLISSNAGLMDWIKENLNVIHFSVSTYIVSSLLPWLQEPVANLTKDMLFICVELMLDNWECLSDEDKFHIKEKAPILLEDGSILATSKNVRIELLVPRTADLDTGWQILLRNKEEYELEDILSEDYMRFSKNHSESLKELFKLFNAQKYPDLKTHGINCEKLKSLYPDYFNFLSENHEEVRVGSAEVKTWLPPSFMFDNEKMLNLRNRTVLLCWLEGVYESRTSDLKNAEIKLFSNRFSGKQTMSGLRYYLRMLPWIQTTQGFKSPNQVFLETKQNNEIFGERIAYLKDEINSEICEYLGIKSEVNTDSILDFLTDLSQQSNADLKLVSDLYKYLDNFGGNYSDKFQREKLIYLPNQEGKWFSAGEVVWESSKKALGNLYGWMSPIYDSTGLKTFFVDKIGVPESVEIRELAKAWSKLPDRKDLGASEIEAALEVIYPRVLDALNSDLLSEWWSDLSDSLKVWTQNHEFSDGSNIYSRRRKSSSEIWENYCFCLEARKTYSQ